MKHQLEQATERRQFQWPWTTPNPVFKVTLFFDRTHAFEWYQFEWTSVTFFKVTIIERQITRKWYNTELYLQWPTTRKSHIIYRTAPFSMTLNDPYPQFQGHAILWCWISQKRYETQTQLQWNTNRDLRPTQHCYFEWPWVNLNDLAEYSMTRSVALSLRQVNFL